MYVMCACPALSYCSSVKNSKGAATGPAGCVATITGALQVEVAALSQLPLHTSSRTCAGVGAAHASPGLYWNAIPGTPVGDTAIEFQKPDSSQPGGVSMIRVVHTPVAW